MKYDDASLSGHAPMVVAGYVRRSSQMQKDNFSIDAQKRALSEECQRRNLPELVFYEDDERSARGEQIAKRPAFEQLLTDITAGKVQMVMVHSFDRWSRNVMVILQSFRVLAQAHATFLSLSEHIDYSTPEGRLQLTILAAFAAYFSDVLAIHTSKGKHERAAQGLCNGDIPFGYRSTGPKTPPEQDPVTLAGVRLMGTLRTEGLSMDRIAEEMNAAGYRTGSKRFGQRLFTGDTVRAMLRNEFYAAYVPGDERGTILSHGKRYRGQHLAAFTREEWEAMQQVRAMPAQRPCTEKESAPPPAFAGTLVCAFCGQKLSSRKGTAHDYYKDVAHVHGVACPAGGYLQVRQEVVTHQFGELLQQIPVATVSEELGGAQQGTDAPILAPEEAIVSDNVLAGLQTGGEEETRQAGQQRHPEPWPDGALAEQELPHECKAHLLAGAQLAAIKENWQTASVQQQRVMVTTLLEPEGMQYAIEQERMVVLIPRSPFLSWFAQIPGARLVQMEQGSRIVLEPSVVQLREVPASDKGRRSSKRASPEQEPVQGVLAKRRRPLQRRPGPDRPAWKIDPAHWPEVVKRIEHGGSLRQVARAYQVSHETIRRVLVTVQGSGEKNRSRNRHAQEKEGISVPRLGERRRRTGKKKNTRQICLVK